MSNKISCKVVHNLLKNINVKQCLQLLRHMKNSSNVINFPIMEVAKPKPSPSPEEEKSTITFLPTPEVRRLLRRAMVAMGEAGTIYGAQSKLINDAIRAGLPAVLKRYVQDPDQQSMLLEFFENAANKPKNSGKAQ